MPLISWHVTLTLKSGKKSVNVTCHTMQELADQALRPAHGVEVGATAEVPEAAVVAPVEVFDPPVLDFQDLELVRPSAFLFNLNVLLLLLWST